MSIDELKKLQLKIIKKNNKCNLLSTIIIFATLIISVIIFYINNIEIKFIFIILFFELFFSTIIALIVKNVLNGKDIELFNKNYKNIFVLNALKNNFDDIIYSSDKGFSEKYVAEVGMLDVGDRYYSNDFVSGVYKGVKFEQADIHIEEKYEEKDEHGQTKNIWETLFRGRLMIFDFNKKFKANIQVSSRYFDANSLPWGKNFTRVKMEDLEFNQNFCVYAQSEYEAFYILTPHFMEKIKEVTSRLNCGVMFCFIDNRLHVAIDNNEDSFEWNVFNVINEQEIEDEIMKNIKLITKFVNELSLDNDLFKKKD